MNRRGQLVGNRLAVTTVAVVFVLVTSVLGAPASVSASGPSTAEPGGEVTMSFSLTNTGESASAYTLDVSVPTEWTVTSHSDDEGKWKASDASWLWQTVNASESVNPSVTLLVPDDASGEYTISATGKDSDGVVGSDSVTVQTPSPESHVDRNANARCIHGKDAFVDRHSGGGQDDGAVPGFSLATATASLGMLLVLRRIRGR